MACENGQYIGKFNFLCVTRGLITSARNMLHKNGRLRLMIKSVLAIFPYLSLHNVFPICVVLYFVSCVV